MKRINFLNIIALILLPCIMLSFAACNKNDQEQQSEQKVDINSISFMSTSLVEICSDYRKNALRANDTYVNNYFSITADFYSAQDETSFTLGKFVVEYEGEYYGTSLCCNCYIKEDILDSETFNDLKNKLYLLNSDETVTVKGKITSIDRNEIHLDVYQIQ